jgi:hypothetical protein
VTLKINNQHTLTLKRIGFFCFPIKHSTHTEGGGKMGTATSWESMAVVCGPRQAKSTKIVAGNP